MRLSTFKNLLDSTKEFLTKEIQDDLNEISNLKRQLGSITRKILNSPKNSLARKITPRMKPLTYRQKLKKYPSPIKSGTNRAKKQSKTFLEPRSRSRRVARKIGKNQNVLKKKLGLLFNRKTSPKGDKELRVSDNIMLDIRRIKSFCNIRKTTREKSQHKTRESSNYFDKIDKKDERPCTLFNRLRKSGKKSLCSLVKKKKIKSVKKKYDEKMTQIRFKEAFRSFGEIRKMIELKNRKSTDF